MNVINNTNMDVSGVSNAVVTERPEASQSAKKANTENVALQSEDVTRADAEAMVDALKELTETLQTKLNFSVDEGTNDIVVKVIDRDTDTVIKQIPPESMLELQEKMQDLTGFLLSDIF